jgi:hypothetical protein
MPKVDEMHECLSDALAAAQAEFEPILKNKTAATPKYSYPYADIADVIAAVTPALSKHGLCQMQRMAIRDGQQLLLTELRFKAECLVSEMILPIAGLDPQGVGKVLTYFRRYALQALLGVAAERDDDAADTGEVRQPEAARRAPEPDMHDLIVQGEALIEAVEAAEGRDELAEIARRARTAWAPLKRANGTLAAELQAAIKKQAAALGLDLASV